MLEAREKLEAVARLHHVIARRAERRRDERAERVVVLGEEDAPPREDLPIETAVHRRDSMNRHDRPRFTSRTEVSAT